MGSRDSVHYGFRLNISNPRQLELHKILRDLNPAVYKSKSSFIIESLEKQLTQEGADKVKQAGGYATVEYVDKARDSLKEELRKELEAEIKQELFSMFLAATGGGGNSQYMKAPNDKQPENEASDKDRKEAEKVLSELTDLWS